MVTGLLQSWQIPCRATDRRSPIKMFHYRVAFRTGGAIPILASTEVASILRGCWIVLPRPVVLRSEGGTLLSSHKQCRKLAPGLSDPTNQRSRDCGRPGSQNKAVARRLDRRADPGEVIEQIVGNVHISASEPGGTSRSASASGIGLIGLIGARVTPPSGSSVL